jgi:hypothetical protein
MFWLSIALAIGIGAFAIFGAKVGIGTPLIALIFAGNAYARLHRPAGHVYCCMWTSGTSCTFRFRNFGPCSHRPGSYRSRNWSWTNWARLEENESQMRPNNSFKPNPLRGSA